MTLREQIQEGQSRALEVLALIEKHTADLKDKEGIAWAVFKDEIIDYINDNKYESKMPRM